MKLNNFTIIQKIELNYISKTQLRNVAKTIKNLVDDKNFIIWLEGPLGVGKTTLVKEVLYTLGLNKKDPVLSPSFVYMNEYKINNLWYAHLDFYRVSEKLNINDFGIFDYKDYKGIFIEWPQKITNSESLYPNFIIHINFSKKSSLRNYQIFQIA